MLLITCVNEFLFDIIFSIGGISFALSSLYAVIKLRKVDLKTS
jgi:hypothetical protein